VREQRCRFDESERETRERERKEKEERDQDRERTTRAPCPGYYVEPALLYYYLRLLPGWLPALPLLASRSLSRSLLFLLSSLAHPSCSRAALSRSLARSRARSLGCRSPRSCSRPIRCFLYTYANRPRACATLAAARAVSRSAAALRLLRSSRLGDGRNSPAPGAAPALPYRTPPPSLTHSPACVRALPQTRTHAPYSCVVATRCLA